MLGRKSKLQEISMRLAVVLDLVIQTDRQFDIREIV